jgi:hypothetical protein
VNQGVVKPARSSWAGIALFVGWAAPYMLARLALDKDLALESKALRIGAALLPVIPTIAFLWAAAAHIRSLDELHRRVHLEALSIAYPLAVLLLLTLGLLELAVGLNPNDWSYRHVWPFLPCFYFLGLAIAWRRYQ